MHRLRSNGSFDEPAREADLDELATEAGSQAGADYDLRPTPELVALMNAADETVPAAVAAATGQIVAVIETIAESPRPRRTPRLRRRGLVRADRRARRRRVRVDLLHVPRTGRGTASRAGSTPRLSSRRPPRTTARRDARTSPRSSSARRTSSSASARAAGRRTCSQPSRPLRTRERRRRASSP